ncbi:MAG: hypothetical protein ACYCQI_14970 [Gammaproteobacteria bacterium]
MAKNSIRTSKPVAKTASKVLRDKTAKSVKKLVKQLAGSSLVNRKAATSSKRK